MSKIKIVTASLSLCVFLAGCQSTGPFGSRGSVGSKVASNNPEAGLTPNPNAAINGNWVPTDTAAVGVYVAEFRNGVFVSRSPTTNKPLAKGSYRVVSDKQVDLDFVGAATQTAVKAKCDRKTVDTLYCVPTVGSPFNLRRA